jgi:hypothetical protein
MNKINKVVFMMEKDDLSSYDARVFPPYMGEESYHIGEYLTTSGGVEEHVTDIVENAKGEIVVFVNDKRWVTIRSHTVNRIFYSEE